jgi:hypothetical protein
MCILSYIVVSCLSIPISVARAWRPVLWPALERMNKKKWGKRSHGKCNCCHRYYCCLYFKSYKIFNDCAFPISVGTEPVILTHEWKALSWEKTVIVSFEWIHRSIGHLTVLVDSLTFPAPLAVYYRCRCLTTLCDKSECKSRFIAAASRIITIDSYNVTNRDNIPISVGMVPSTWFEWRSLSQKQLAILQNAGLVLFLLSLTTPLDPTTIQFVLEFLQECYSC